ncbi:MAG: hypothetical protein ACK4WB_10195 [Desulfatiglandales bacterium]
MIPITVKCIKPLGPLIPKYLRFPGNYNHSPKIGKGKNTKGLLPQSKRGLRSWVVRLELKEGYGAAEDLELGSRA